MLLTRSRTTPCRGTGRGGKTGSHGVRAPVRRRWEMPGRLGVHSEVGRLRQVVLHRPGLELTRLTPANCLALLFDDVLWTERAQEDHDAFARLLRDHGVQVHYFGDLLADVLAQPEPRAFVLDRVCTPQRHGPALAAALRSLADDVEPARLAE